MGMVAIIASVVAAISATIIAVLTYKIRKDENMPFIQFVRTVKHDTFAIVQLKVYPAKHPVAIRRISSNTNGIAHAPYGYGWFKPADEHFHSLNVEIDLLPSHLSMEALEFVFSLSLKHAQNSISILLYSASSRFSVPISKNTITITAQL